MTHNPVPGNVDTWPDFADKLGTWSLDVQTVVWPPTARRYLLARCYDVGHCFDRRC
jgi:hypothetical protein